MFVINLIIISSRLEVTRCGRRLAECLLLFIFVYCIFPVQFHVYSCLSQMKLKGNDCICPDKDQRRIQYVITTLLWIA